jgi:uncharacterized protein YgbK (DUF1537 family)
LDGDDQQRSLAPYAHPGPALRSDDLPADVHALAGLRALLAWDAPAVSTALGRGASVHLITNSRAQRPEKARDLVESTARVALAAVPEAHLVLRGDSTLRGHLKEEYEAVAAAVGRRSRPPLLLAPALPSAGRVTRAGVHLIERNGAASALHETEYARDGLFSYSTARLLNWAEERSGGLFEASLGRELHLGDRRRGGGSAVAAALRDLASAGRPAVLAPDAETDDDLALIAAGFAQAVREGIPALVRCAPAFAGVLTGTTAPGLAPPPLAGPGGVLVVCGSYVPTTTRQLAALAATGAEVVAVDADALARDEAGPEIARATAAASVILRREGLVVVATPRTRSEHTGQLEAGERIATGLALIAGRVEPAPSVVIAKGGITSAVTLRTGFGCKAAEVVGPVLPGVSHWRADARGGALDYLVVPGNVGADDLLARLVDAVLRR